MTELVILQDEQAITTSLIGRAEEKLFELSTYRTKGVEVQTYIHSSV